MAEYFADSFIVGAVLYKKSCKCMTKCMYMFSVDAEFFAGICVISSKRAWFKKFFLVCKDKSVFLAFYFSYKVI